MKTRIRVGILGAGQLALMLIGAIRELGKLVNADMIVRLLDMTPHACARPFADEFVLAKAYDDEVALAQFAQGLGYATSEFENFPEGVARFLINQGVIFFPE